MQTNMKAKLTFFVFQKHHNFTCWLTINKKYKQIWKQNWLSWSFKNITILHVDWQWMKNAKKYENKIDSLGLEEGTVLIFQKLHNFTCWLAMNEKCKQYNKIYSLGLLKTSQFYMLIGNEWKMQTNMKTKFTLLVFQKHHNFTCWLAMNEKCKQYDNKIYSLSLSKTSQFYMLIGNEWKLQTNMKIKLTLLVFQKHHNFTCWLAINENANNMITKFTLVGLSKTSQFYMLIGN